MYDTGYLELTLPRYGMILQVKAINVICLTRWERASVPHLSFDWLNLFRQKSLSAFRLDRSLPELKKFIDVYFIALLWQENNKKLNLLEF